MPSHEVEQYGDKVGVEHVVAVHHHHQFAAHRFEARIACRRMAAVGLMDDTHAAVTLGPTVADGRSAVGAAIVHDDDFETGIVLQDDAFQALVQKGLAVVDRHDDRDERLHFFQ